MIQWHVFLSVPKHYNPYLVTLFGMYHYSHVLPTDSSNFAGHAWPITELFKAELTYNSYEGFGHASTH